MLVVKVGIFMLAAMAALAQQMPPVVGGSTVTDLAGTDTLVTVVLKGSGALDKNLRVTKVGQDFLGVADQKGREAAYLFTSIQEVRVQKGAVEKRELNLAEVKSLRVEEQRVLERAFARAREIYDSANEKQDLKMRAAVLIAVGGDKEGLDYLQKLAATNHTETSLDAYLCLYLAGDNGKPAPVIDEGLKSGSRAVKAKAAHVAGLTGYEGAIPVLAQLVQDRLAEISVPAAMALARLGWRDVVPELLRMLTELNETKGEAAIFGLSRLAGQDVVSQAREMLQNATIPARYRLIMLLYKLEEPGATALLAEEGIGDQGKALRSAVALAERGEWSGRNYLNEFLKNKYYDQNERNIVARAQAAAALVAANDLTAASELQKLLAINIPAAQKEICLIMAKLGHRRLIPVQQPTLETADVEVAVQACTSVVAMADPQFRARLVEFLEE